MPYCNVIGLADFSYEYVEVSCCDLSLKIAVEQIVTYYVGYSVCFNFYFGIWEYFFCLLSEPTFLYVQVK